MFRPKAAKRLENSHECVLYPQIRGLDERSDYVLAQRDRGFR